MPQNYTKIKQIYEGTAKKPYTLKGKEIFFFRRYGIKHVDFMFEFGKDKYVKILK